MRKHFSAMASRSAVTSILSTLVLTAVTGCQHYAKITWDRPKPVEVNERTTLAVGDLAELKRKGGLWAKDPPASLIGKHTFTVFAIPTTTINTHEKTPLKQSFEKAVREALEAAGFELVEASEAPANAPLLRGEVNACWWWSYMWFWPFTIQGGENKVTLFLEDPDGAVLWKHEFSRIQPGMAFGGAYAFDLMIKWSMTKLLQDIVRECSSGEFKAALSGGQARMRLEVQPLVRR